MKLKIFHFYIELKKVPKRGRKGILKKRGRKQKRISLNCDYCGKEIIRRPSQIKKVRHCFCSHSCHSKFHYPSKKVRSDKGKSHRGQEESIKRRESIKQMRIENPSATLKEIGLKYGISRERVRQILKGEGLPTKSYKEAKSSVQRYCAHCGAEITLSGRLRKYCLKCSQESQRYFYHFLDDEAKRRQRLQQIAWMKRNPEKVKVIQERATKIYQNKMRAEHYKMRAEHFERTHYEYIGGNLLPLGTVFKAIGCDANHRLVLSDGRKIPVGNVKKVEN